MILDLIQLCYEPEHTAMVQHHELPTTSVLFIDGYDSDRTYYAAQLKRYSPDYQILEATDGHSGLTRYRSHKIDCVVLELNLPDISGFQVLIDLIPLARRPNVAVIILTRLSSQPLWELAKKQGAYDCFLKKHTAHEDLDKAIQRAIALVGLIPKEDNVTANGIRVEKLSVSHSEPSRR